MNSIREKKTWWKYTLIHGNFFILEGEVGKKEQDQDYNSFTR